MTLCGNVILTCLRWCQFDFGLLELEYATFEKLLQKFKFNLVLKMWSFFLFDLILNKFGPKLWKALIFLFVKSTTPNKNCQNKKFKQDFKISEHFKLFEEIVTLNK